MTEELKKLAPIVKKSEPEAGTAQVDGPNPDANPPPAQPAPPPTDDLTNVTQPGLSDEAMAALALTPNRRDDVEPKKMETPAAFDPSASVLAKADARVHEMREQSIFMSKFPRLTMYVKPAGYRIDVKIEFKNGVYATSDEQIAAAMRMHPRIGKLFREERSVRTAAVRAEAARQRDTMRAPTFAGTNTSVDGAEQTFFAADVKLSELERRAVESGSVG